MSLGLDDLAVGHWTDPTGLTGCTVVIPPAGNVASVSVRGGGPGTRETDLLAPQAHLQGVSAVLLTGGSAFGLAAWAGVMRYLEERGVGYPIGSVRVPIVAGAVIFDLLVGDAAARPDAASGYAACEAATDGDVAEGSVGVGTGATVGKLLGEGATKGGLGTASATIGAGHTVGVVAVANAVGDVIDRRSGGIAAGARLPDGSGWTDIGSTLFGSGDDSRSPLENTTLAVVATDATLTKEEASVVAMMAHDGIARATRPSHTMLDGDTVFVLASCSKGPADITALGHVSAELVADAVVGGVRAAEGLGGVPALRDLAQPG
jgi:L-aminopeptidase/D-esterase-like protein